MRLDDVVGAVVEGGRCKAPESGVRGVLETGGEVRSMKCLLAMKSNLRVGEN